MLFCLPGRIGAILKRSISDPESWLERERVMAPVLGMPISGARNYQWRGMVAGMI